MTDTVDTRHSSSQMRSAKLAELRRFWRRFLRNRLGVLGLAITVALVLCAILAPLLATKTT